MEEWGLGALSGRCTLDLAVTSLCGQAWGMRGAPPQPLTISTGQGLTGRPPSEPFQGPGLIIVFLFFPFCQVAFRAV